MRHPGVLSKPDRGILSATEVLPSLEKEARVLHMVLTPPPVWQVCLLLTHLSYSLSWHLVTLVVPLNRLCPVRHIQSIGADLHYLAHEPDTSEHCKTADTIVRSAMFLSISYATSLSCIAVPLEAIRIEGCTMRKQKIFLDFSKNLVAGGIMFSTCHFLSPSVGLFFRSSVTNF